MKERKLPRSQPTWDAPFGDLTDCETRIEMRAATREELEQSRNSPTGTFMLDGKEVFVWEPGS